MRDVIRTARLEDLVGIDAGLILLDPPFAFRTWSEKGEGRSPQRRYSCMGAAELADLPLRQIAGSDAWVACWVPNPHMRLVGPMMQAWRVRFSGSGLIWIKTNRDGSIWSGGGFSTRKNAEICWLGRIGSPKRSARDVSEVILSRRRAHSQKP